MEENEFPGPGDPQVLGGVEHQVALNNALDALERAKTIDSIWSRDPSVWKSEPEHQKIIENALGWLTVAESLLANCDDLAAFAEEVRGDGFKHVLLLGMGGSSLCPEVFRRSFGHRQGSPELLVLDSTVPASLLG